MGFFNRLGNWIRGRGWRDTEPQIPIPPREDMERAEDLQYTSEDQQAEEQPQEIEPKPTIPKEEKKTIGTEVEESKQTPEMKEAVKKIEKAPKTKEVEKGISPEGQNKVSVTQTNLGTLNDLKPQYTQIFTENAKLTDPDILDVLYRGRAQLQHRFTAQITVHVDNKLGNTLEVVGALIEQTQMTYNFVTIDMQIDSAGILDSILTELGQAFENHYGAISSTLKGRNMHTGKITSIDIDVTFA